MNKKQLWLNLKAYHFDNLVSPNLWEQVKEKFGGTDASTRAFADKIARKSGWANRFSLQAISEYKKFVYLGVVSDFNATPSKVIDKVWHEHLLFSRAYREFCTTVIQYDFDHHPELVPITDQTGTFNAQYLDTIKLYKTEFGVDPPSAVWSVPKFDKKAVPVVGYESQKKRSNVMYMEETPLCAYFDSSEISDQSNAFPEFNDFGGGSFGGAGASESWDFTDSSSGADSSSSVSSSDSGSSCSSGCSSSGGGD